MTRKKFSPSLRPDFLLGRYLLLKKSYILANNFFKTTKDGYILVLFNPCLGI